MNLIGREVAAQAISDLTVVPVDPGRNTLPVQYLENSSARLAHSSVDRELGAAEILQY